MTNRFGVVTKNKIVSVTTEVYSTPKGLRTTPVIRKPRPPPVRARKKRVPPQKKHDSKTTNTASTSQPSSAWTWDSFNDPPLCIFDPEPESMFNATTQTKSQHDFMDEWWPRRDLYLRAIILRDVLHDGGECHRCLRSSGLWRCGDCLGSRPLCRECCQELHTHLPFHRIEYWNGSHYQQDWLYNLGVVVELGHRGNPCPVKEPIIRSAVPDQTLPKSKGVNVYASPSGVINEPLDCVPLIIGHVNGIHKVWVRHCGCREGGEEYQLLEIGLYPLSFQRIQSAFTFDLLDDVRLENLECKASIYHYYHKLRRSTCPLFPNDVPNRYQELYRVVRQWRFLKQSKWSGASFPGVDSVGPGSLAMFCAACPQPDTNTPSNWNSDPEEIVYTRSFVMDGNFSAVHQRRQNAVPEKCLTQGSLYMVGEQKYKCHLASATEYKDPATCNEHHAITDKFTKHKGQDVTGIGATACARHGAFCPSGVVNFQRGERQMNMDYSLCHAIAHGNVGDIKNLIVLYDVNCQYHVNLPRRVKDSTMYLSYPFEKKTYFGVGAFHISGHVPRCFPRHSPQFIPGAGVVDGEILETRWSVLNEVSPSAQTASLAARTEMLDDHMLDANWKTLINIVSSITKKHSDAVTNAQESNAYLQELSDTIEESMLQRWEEQMAKAQRDRTSSAEAMDIFDTRLEDGLSPSCAQKQVELLREESRSAHLQGSAAWLADGLDIQEAQLLLCSEARRHQKHRSDDDEVVLMRKRQQLDVRLEKHQEQAEKYFPVAAVNQAPDFDESNVDDGWEDDEENKGNDPAEPTQFTFTSLLSSRLAPHAEKRSMLLPSTLGHQACRDLCLQSLLDKELALRQGQANDALHAIRMAIGEKSFRFRKQLRNAKTKTKKTRNWDGIHAASKRLQHNRLIYRQARHAMIQLGASSEILQRYPELKDEDLRTSTAVQEPNARGQRNQELSWIWRVPGLTLQSDATLLNELYRVNWIRAKSRRDRWSEELSITCHEMLWVLLFFRNRAQLWRTRGDNAADAAASRGLQAYAYRQATNWQKLYQVAFDRFHYANPDLVNVFGYESISTQ